MSLHLSNCQIVGNRMHWLILSRKTPEVHLQLIWSLQRDKIAIVQGRFQDFWKGVNMYKGVGFRFADFISFSISHENEIFWLRPNYKLFHFHEDF